MESDSYTYNHMENEQVQYPVVTARKNASSPELDARGRAEPLLQTLPATGYVHMYLRYAKALTAGGKPGERGEWAGPGP